MFSLPYSIEMNGVTQDLVSQIAIALNSTDTPPNKNGITYRILVFKEKNLENWVLALLPDIIMVEELFVMVNESFELFLNGSVSPNGITFLCAHEPHLLIEVAKDWYFEKNLDNVACS